MKHVWVLIETTKEWYYVSQNKDGSWNKTPVLVEECDLCHLRRRGPFSEQGCYHFYEFFQDGKSVYPEPSCLEPT